jgi:outer membrane murein-binding lipoprotein Lpp
MRSISTRELRRYVVVLLAFACATPFLSGCSTLGIATTDDLTAAESRLQNSQRATTTRVDNLEKNTSDLQATLTQISSNIDTLNTRFARAKVWLENMNIDTIAADSQEASAAAISAEARSRAFFSHYLDWIKSLNAMLEEQITTLETQMKSDATGTPKSPDSTGGTSSEKPDDSGGDGG